MWELLRKKMRGIEAALLGSVGGFDGAREAIFVPI